MKLRKALARRIRSIVNWPHTPVGIARPLKGLAHRLAPHELRCKLCGFTSVSDGDDWAHAGRAYDHWETVHSLQDSETGEHRG